MFDGVLNVLWNSQIRDGNKQKSNQFIGTSMKESVE